MRVHIDAAEYFRAFMLAALQARHTLFIVGWDFHSRTTLLCEGETLPEDPAAPRLLGDFLNYIAARNRGLRIRILVWDFPTLFGAEREFPLFYGLGLPGTWQPHKRIELLYDGSHRLGGSHHQKIVVVDERLAFCGGIDLTLERWDTCEHRPQDERRANGDKTYAPVHDTVMEVAGDSAQALAEHVRERWRRAGGSLSSPARLALSRQRRDTAPRAAAAADDPLVLASGRIAISRTLPPTVQGAGAVREVEALYLDMIHAARKYIMIESQYFTSQVLGDALAERLAEPDGPELLVIVRCLSHGWLEALSMERLRSGLVQRLRNVGGDRRIKVCYPHVDGLTDEMCVNLHSKVMIVDDRFLRIGSANFANRSMGLDSECDLTLEGRDDRSRQFIEATRARLLAEHLGSEEETVQREIGARGSLLAAVEALNTHPGRCLRELCLNDDSALPALIARLGDPEEPVTSAALRALLASDNEGAPAVAVGKPRSRSALRRWLPVAGVLVFALLMTLAWRYTALADYANPDTVIHWARQVGAHWWAPLLVLLAYTPGCLILFPRPLITLFAVMAFGSWLGFLYTLCGLVIAALATYFAGRLMQPATVANLVGPRLNNVMQVLRRRGLVAMTALRLVPLAPFAVEGMAAGVIRIKLWQFAAGTALGMLPGTLAATVFADQLQAALSADSRVNYVLLAAVLVLLAGGAWFVRRWFERQQHDTT